MSDADSPENIASAPRPSSVRMVTLLVGLIVVAFVITSRVRTLSEFSDQRQFHKYTTLAEEVARGELPSDRLNDVSPLYLIVTSVWNRAGLDWNQLLDAQIVALGLIVVLAGLIADRLGGIVAGVAAGAFLLTYRATFLNATELEPETLILLLNTAGLFLIVDRRCESRRVTAVAGGFLLLGLSAAARPTVVPSALLVAFWLLCENRRPSPDRTATWKLVLAMGLGVAMPLLVSAGVLSSLTGQRTIMNPGTVFYEGMNPGATGYGSSEPLIVADLRSVMTEPDSLHIAYRIVASRARGAELSPEETNRYWLGRALGFVRRFPGQALRLVTRKVFFAFHNYECWDLGTMINRENQLRPGLWTPFVLMIAFAGMSLTSAGDRRWTIPLALYVLGYVVVMALFYVTSRQRNPIIPAVAVLAGLGLSALLAEIRGRGWKRTLALVCSAILMVALLGRTYGWQVEDRYYWMAVGQSKSLANAAYGAERQGDTEAASRLTAFEGTWLVLDDPHIPAVPRKTLGSAALSELARTESDPRLFDLAIALLKAGHWSQSDQILEGLEEVHYHPSRKLAVVSSVSYYRALGAIREGRSGDAVDFLERASSEAPGNADVLALGSVLVPHRDSGALFAIHDPFTADLALARAQYELGHRETAERIASKVEAGIPAWQRASFLRDFFQRRSDPPGALRRGGGNVE